MQIDLVFPPFDYSVLMPEIGIPLLAVQLRRAGFEVRQADWNIEFIVRELGDLSAQARLLDRLPPAAGGPRRASGGESSQLLDLLARRLSAAAGRRRATKDDPFDPIRAVERRTQKSCHFRPHQALWDWREQLEQLPARQRDPRDSEPAVLASLARCGAREAGFRASLLRLLQHLHFAPASYVVDDVLAAADRPDPLLDPFYDRRLDLLFADRTPRVFGIAIWSIVQLAPALRLARRVRRLLPRATLVAGGAWCTYMGRRLQAVPELFDRFDAVLPGEADTSLVSLARAVAEDRPISGLPGVVDLEAARAGRVTPPPPRSLEAIGQAEYDDLPLALYPERKLVLRLSRGCYWGRCTICSHVLPETNRRHASPKEARLTKGHREALAAHVRHVGERHGIRHFTTADNLVPPGIMRQLCELNRTERLGFTWDSLARFHREYDGDFCRMLAAGGCRRLDLGLETTDEAELKRIHKGLRLDTALRALRNLHRAGVGVMVFVMSYPGQPPEVLERSLQWLAEHRELVLAVSISRFHLASSTRPWIAPGALGIEPTAGRERDLNVYDLGFSAAGTLDDDAFTAVVRRYADRLPLGRFVFGGDGRGT